MDAPMASARRPGRRGGPGPSGASPARVVCILPILALAGCASPSLTTPITQISESGQGAYEVSLAAGESGLVAAWYDTRDGNPEIYLRALDADGRPAGPERRLTDDPNLSYEADVGLLGGDLVVAWYDRSPTGLEQAKVGRWSVDGTRRWVRSLAESGQSARNPLVRVYDETLFCAWIAQDAAGAHAVWARWLDASGRPVTPPRRLAAAGDTTWNLNAALDGDGMAWVVFDAAVGTQREELILVRVAGDRHEVTRLTADDGFASKYPDLALAGDRAALVWYDERDGNREVYLFTAPRDNLAAGVAAGAVRVTRTPGDSIGAYVSWNGRRVGLAWSDDHDGQHEVFFQSFDPAGRPHEPARQLTDNATASLIPAIAPWGDGFALAWNEDVIDARGDHASGGRSEIVFTRVE